VEPPSIPDVLAERPITVFGSGEGNSSRNIALQSQRDPPFEAIVPVEKAKPVESNSALRYLWARHRISLLSDYNTLRPMREGERSDQPWLTYNLLTSYTSLWPLIRRYASLTAKR